MTGRYNTYTCVSAGRIQFDDGTPSAALQHRRNSRRIFTNVMGVDSDTCVLRDSDIEKCKNVFHARNRRDGTARGNRRRPSRARIVVYILALIDFR